MISNIDNWLICLSTTLSLLLINLTSISATTNSMRINVYFEPQETESTKIFNEELLPLFQIAGISGRLNLKLIPFGRAKCNPAHHEYNCTCPQGSDQCDLMNLMACTLHDYRHHEDSLELISCIQGQSTLEEAHRNCIKTLPSREAEWLKRCPREFRGKYLSWLNGLRTKASGLSFSTVPVASLNGEILQNPFGLKDQICRKFENPKPRGC